MQIHLHHDAVKIWGVNQRNTTTLCTQGCATDAICIGWMDAIRCRQAPHPTSGSDKWRRKQTVFAQL